MKRTIVGVLVAGMALTACGSEGTESASTTSTTSTDTSTDSSVDDTATDEAPDDGVTGSDAYDPHSHLDFSSVTEEDFAEAAVERGFFQLDEWHDLFPADRELMDEIVASLSEDPVQADIELDEPIQIAMMFPSLELSDAFGRLNLSIRGHLDAIGIPYEVTEFLINSGEHDTQAGQIEQVLANSQDYDYVIIGPSEYEVQKSNIARLVEEIPTLVMNVVNPFTDWVGTENMPLTHISFDHVEGALLLCEKAIELTGGEGDFALVRYLPGLIDEGRSDTFANCVQENSDMGLVDEYPTEGDQEQAFTGANAILSAHDDLALIHSGSTAVALGVLAALDDRGLMDEIYTNGWGGGEDELNAILDGDLDFTVFRVNDDWGAATAEVIRRHLQGEPFPVAIAPTMQIIDQSWTEEDISELTEYAFRYSGQLER